jgi:hypothetical protein
LDHWWFLFRHRGGNTFVLEDIFDSEKDALDFVTINPGLAKGSMLVNGTAVGVRISHAGITEWTDPRPPSKKGAVPIYLEDEEEEDDDED